jgi:uncharacterized protein with HEPN domain
MSRDPLLYLDELLKAASLACQFGEGLERVEYRTGVMAFEAIVRQIEIIGEAASHVPPHIQAQATEIPWRNLVGMRNHLIHGYFAIDADIVWSVVHDKLPAMLSETRKLIEKLS